MIMLWIEKGLLNPQDYGNLQKPVDSIYVPSSVGCISSKIASSFSSFTADQLKNWTFSLMVLVKTFPKDDIECWRHFVLAARLLCKPCVTLNDITLADAIFVREFKRMYGKNVITLSLEGVHS